MGSSSSPIRFACPSPSCPFVFRPQHRSDPSAITAHECHVPHPTATTWPPSDTVGVLEGSSLSPMVVVWPSPSWPSPLSPQQRSDPSVSTAQVWTCPHDTEDAEPFKDTAGTLDGNSSSPTSSVCPSPSCPLSFQPQHRSVPSNSTTHVCAQPPATDTTGLSNATAGTAAGSSSSPIDCVFPRPSWPLSFEPQHRSVPSERTAQECQDPQAMVTAEPFRKMTGSLEGGSLLPIAFV